MRHIREKFKKKINFVKPLYRKVKSSNKIKNKKDTLVTIDIDKTYKLGGDAINVKQKLLSDQSANFNVITVKPKASSNVSPSLYLSNNINSKSVRNISVSGNVKDLTKSVKEVNNMLGIVELSDAENREPLEKEDKSEDGANNKSITIHTVPDTWLRVYPAPKAPGESICSVVFRCLACQLGLVSFLVLWTLLWILVIHSFEGPNETEVLLEFENQQNQLIIDLATELRQVTPVSPKWRAAIEARIGDERQLTILAVGKGARLHPGQFWDIPGTFLFSIYVMTALGFGAPVPQTLYGRTSTLIYAALAVPAHIYLMVNASTCVVIRVEKAIDKVNLYLMKSPFVAGKSESAHNTGITGNLNSRNTELQKSPNSFRNNMLCFLKVVCVGRGVPLASLLYYLSGAGAFGVARSKQPLDVVMFPLEFTTTGGLEQVESHVRILYGLYVEGGMCLVSCALATLRRHSGAAAASVARKYRLYATEPGDCGTR